MTWEAGACAWVKQTSTSELDSHKCYIRWFLFWTFEFHLCHDIPSLLYQALTGFLIPDPSVMKGPFLSQGNHRAQAQPRSVAWESSAPLFLLSCGCWHDTCHPRQETPFLSILLLDQISPPPPHIFLSLRIQRSPTQSGGEWVAWWHDKTEWLVGAERQRGPPWSPESVPRLHFR